MKARRAAEFAAFAESIAQAARSRGPEALVGYGLGAAAAAQALTRGLAGDRVALVDLRPDLPAGSPASAPRGQHP